MGGEAATMGGIGWEDLEGPDMVIFCIDLRDGCNQRAWLIFIRCAYYNFFNQPFHVILCV